MLQHAQGLVYSLICLMPSIYQKASLKALLGQFLSEQGHALPEHTLVKSASSLSRFLNYYRWPTRQVIRTMRYSYLATNRITSRPSEYSSTGIDRFDHEKRRRASFGI